MMSESATAYPLCWPAGVRHHKHRMRARFSKTEQRQRIDYQGQRQYYSEKGSLSTADALKRLQREVDLLGAKSVVLSTNVELRLDGLPHSNRHEPDDPGACLYFHLNGKPHAMPCDLWD